MDKTEKFELIQDYVERRIDDAESWEVDDWARLYLMDLYDNLDSETLVEMVKDNYPDWFDEEEQMDNDTRVQLIHVIQLLQDLDYYLSTDDEDFSKLENKVWSARQQLKVVQTKVGGIIENLDEILIGTEQ